jgi:hypothetical protein
MRLELANEIVVFLHPPHLYSRQELLATPSGFFVLRGRSLSVRQNSERAATRRVASGGF